MVINSKAYWDGRFSTGNWVNSHGGAQTEFFTEIAIRNLPVWLIEHINRDSLEVCDVGCAQGEGCALLKKTFTNSRIIGIDFSESALLIAREKFPSIEFFCESIHALQARHDVIYASNVLEHFENPIEVIQKLLDQTNHYLVILVPFQERHRFGEHLATFDYHSFPLRVGGFQLTYHKEMNCAPEPNTRYHGLQILVIYAKGDGFTLENFISRPQ